MKEDIHPLVLVSWIDSQGGNHWEFENDLDPNYRLPTIETYGRLIIETDEYVLIASSVMYTGPKLSNQLHSTMTIPKCSITSIHNLISGTLYTRKDK